MPSIDLQSNLIGLQRPLDCFHSEQGLKKYINKSIDPMATEVRAGCGSPLLAKANPCIPGVPRAAFCGYRYPKRRVQHPLIQPPNWGLGCLCRQWEESTSVSPTWDGTLHPRSVPLCWKTRGDREQLFLTQLGPLTQKGKLRQGTEHSQAHGQRQIQALSIPQAQW